MLKWSSSAQISGKCKGAGRNDFYDRGWSTTTQVTEQTNIKTLANGPLGKCRLKRQKQCCPPFIIFCGDLSFGFFTTTSASIGHVSPLFCVVTDTLLFGIKTGHQCRSWCVVRVYISWYNVPCLRLALDTSSDGITLPPSPAFAHTMSHCCA